MIDNLAAYLDAPPRAFRSALGAGLATEGRVAGHVTAWPRMSAARTLLLAGAGIAATICMARESQRYRPGLLR